MSSSGTTTAARVLVLDDEDVVTSAIACFFALETEYEVVQFRCPLAALAYIRDHRVDVVISELSPGIMEGEAFASAAREIQEDLPVIFLSGGVDEARCEKARRLGASWCLHKPWSNRELWSTVRRAFEGRFKKG